MTSGTLHRQPQGSPKVPHGGTPSRRVRGHPNPHGKVLWGSGMVHLNLGGFVLYGSKPGDASNPV